jgi:hypothetical protein
VTVRESFVPFEEALQHLLDLVGSSGIPTYRSTKQEISLYNTSMLLQWLVETRRENEVPRE